jgi:hypothetical protein
VSSASSSDGFCFGASRRLSARGCSILRCSDSDSACA